MMAALATPAAPARHANHLLSFGRIETYTVAEKVIIPPGS
jgi:hypothetical protein